MQNKKLKENPPWPLLDLSAFGVVDTATRRRMERAEKRREAKSVEITRRVRLPWLKGKDPIFNQLHRVALAMAPGCWYARPDIERLVGGNNRSVQWTVAKMLRRGNLERRQNPAWRPHGYVKGLPVPLQAAREPMWLYRLAASGEALRRVAEWLR